MIFKSKDKVPSFIAGDKTIIRELLHPKNDNIDINYSLAHARVEVGEASLPHILHQSSELYYILQGRGEAFIGEETWNLEVGDFVEIPAGVNQWIRNIGAVPLDFLCIVSPPWSADQEEV
jgi:mannose-6-phosphate isomerase-like protein (cupin superfamily)